MTHGYQSRMLQERHRASCALRRQGARHRRGADLAVGILFWFFFIADVFAGCYWPISRVGALVVNAGILPLNSARGVVLLLSALVTPAVVRGIVLLVKPKG